MSKKLYESLFVEVVDFQKTEDVMVASNLLEGEDIYEDYLL